MARIRTIKPSFFTSLTIAELTLEQRLTFIGLWTHADDEGRAIADPRLIKAALWPLDDRTAADLADDLDALTDASLIDHYEVAGRRYLSVNGWSEHQVINRPKKSTFPAPGTDGSKPVTRDNTTLSDGSVTDHGSNTAGREGKGREGNSCPPAARQDVPDGFVQFWEVYPRREARRKAELAFTRACKRAEVSEIIAGARRYADDPNRTKRYTSMAEGWLNGDRWTDDALPGDERPSQQYPRAVGSDESWMS